MLFASFSIYLDVRTTACSLIWRKYCTKVKFHQTLESGGLKNLWKRFCHSLSPDFWIINSLGCSSCDWLQMKSIAEMWRLDVLILTSRRHTSTLWTRTVWRCPICLKRFLRRPIVLTWHRNRLATTNGVTWDFNIPFARSRSTCANFITVN